MKIIKLSSNDCGGFKSPKGHLDTQMFPECKGYETDRDIVKKTVEKRKKNKSKNKSKKKACSCEIVEAKGKKKDWDPNPWAVCNTTVEKDKDPEKFERCVKKVKKQQAFNLKRFTLAQETIDDEDSYQSFSYGTTPEEIIKEKVTKQTPGGYPMHIKNQNEWSVIANVVNQGIDSYLEGFTRSTFDNQTGKCLIHPEEMTTFLRRLSDSGDEEAWILRTDILSTLGIEEI